MSLIVLERASLGFGAQQILDGVSLRIGEGDRIGLIGANGTGKSTLLRVMVGLQGLDGGLVNRTKGCRIGYLPQDAIEAVEDTVLGATLAAVPGRADLEARIAEAEELLGQSDDPDEQMRQARRLADLQDQLEHFERYYSEHQAMRILKGLGFSEGDFARPAVELSGGWQMRGALAGLLFQQPDVLFLDEPTNHLDIPSVVWLDRFLEEYRHALVMICHDRRFLNRHIERVVSFEPEGLRSYRGDYDGYLEQRAAEEEVIEAQARNRERQIRELERFVERFRAKATKARQAQSRAKQIERLQREIEPPPPLRKRLSFSFPAVERTGRDVLLLQGVGKAYGDNALYHALTRGAYAGDRVAIVGPNGVGKTTLLKIMAGELQPDCGEVRYGAGVQVGYFAQHHTEQLDPRRSVLEEVWRQCPGSSESYVRGVCGAFLFSGDDVDKPVAVLSGGERARVLLARLLVNPGNLMLMDEPTTHLDIHAAEALAEALAGFGGALVFVSHNTSFVNRLATKVWDVVDGDVVEYPGNLDEYLQHQQRWQAADEVEAQQEPAAEPQQDRGPSGRESRKARKRREAELRNELGRITRPVREAIDELERRVSELEQEQQELETELADTTVHADQERYVAALRRYEVCRAELEQAMERWEQRHEELERLTAEFNAQLDEDD
jgi:ATP-binding cassette subfamily F protein 3